MRATVMLAIGIMALPACSTTAPRVASTVPAPPRPVPDPEPAAEVPRTEASPPDPHDAVMRGPALAEGIASFYSDRFKGKKTASGARYDPSQMTCAHRKLPFGTELLVHAVRTNRAVRCVVNDRGPFHGRRILDLSRAAAEALGITGVGKVRVWRVAAP